MPENARVILHPRICVIRTQPIEEILPSARIMFAALGHCSLYEEDARTGIQDYVRRNATIFNRWTIDLPKKRVFLTRSVLGI